MSDINKIDLYSLDHIQFPRLIAAINATQDNIDWSALCDELDLPLHYVEEIFYRAQTVHDWNVENIL